VVAGLAFVIGFAVVWHIWWLALTAFVALIAALIIRLTDDDSEYVVSAKQIAKEERLRQKGIAA